MTRLLCIGGSDGGISTALRARDLDPSVEVTVMLADAYPNFSICGPDVDLLGFDRGAPKTVAQAGAVRTPWAPEDGHGRLRAAHI